MTRRNLFFIATVFVLLAGRGAFAERLGGAYRGPEDLTKSEKDSGGTTEGSGVGGGGDGSSGSKSGGGESSGGGTGAGGDSGGGAGGGGDSGGGGGGGDSGGGDSGGGSGPDAGGSGDSSGGKSTGGGGGGDSGGSSSSGGGSSGGGRGKAANSAQDQFFIVSWFFEQNREQLIARYNETQGHRLHIPIHSSATVFGVLPLDKRQRSEITTEDKDKIFDVLKKHATISPDAVVRDAAVIALGKLGSAAAVDLLKLRLGQEHDVAVKQDILVALGMSRAPAAVPLLIDTLRTDKSGKLASFALLGLGLSQDADHEQAGTVALEFFSANLKKSVTEDAVCSAAVAMGALRYGEAAKPLAQALGNKDVASVVRCYCAQALGRIRGDTALKALQEALQKGGQMEVSRAAAIALGSFDDSAVAKLLSSSKEGIKNSDQLSAGLAAVSLGRVLSQIDEDEWKGAPAELRELALKPAKAGIKAQYANLALSLFGGIDKDMQKFYKTSFSETTQDKDVLSSLAMSSGMSGMSEMQTALLTVAKDAGRNAQTRAYAATALGMVGQSQPKETLKSLREIYSGSEDPNIRRGSIFGMGFVGDRSDVPFLLTVLEPSKDESAMARYTRGAAVVALGMIRDGESIARIADLTGRNDAKTRAYAIAALGYLADKDQVPAMSQLFSNTNFRQKCASLDAVMYQL